MEEENRKATKVAETYEERIREQQGIIETYQRDYPGLNIPGLSKQSLEKKMYSLVSHPTKKQN